MIIEKKYIKIMYIYYFILSGTSLKTLKPFRILDVFFLILLPAYAFLDTLGNREKLKNKFEWSMVAIITIFYIFQSFFVSENFFQEIIYLIPGVISYSIIYSGSERLDKKDYQRILMVILFLLMISLLKVQLTFLGIESGGTNRHYARGIFNNSIGIGMYSFIGLFLSDLYLKSFKWRITSGIICIAGLLTSNTRGYMVGIIIYFLLSRGFKAGKILRNISLGILGLIVGINLNLINLDKILNKYGNKNLDLLTGRSAIWNRSYQYYLENNIFGSGVGHYSLINSLKKYGHPENVHQGYLDIVFSAGIIIGTLILFWIGIKIIKAVKMNRRISRKSTDKKIAFLIGVLVLNLGESLLFFTRVPVSILFWSFLGDLNYIQNTIKGKRL